MTESVSLLILDFDGVCVRGFSEQVSGNPGVSLAELARPEIEALVVTAQNRGAITVVLSNEISESWSADVPVLGMVEHVVNCADNGILKPDRRAFQRCLSLTGCRAGQALVVDDRSDNITVAQSLGMHSVLFDPSNPTASIAELHRKLLS